MQNFQNGMQGLQQGMGSGFQNMQDLGANFVPGGFDPAALQQKRSILGYKDFWVITIVPLFVFFFLEIVYESVFLTLPGLCVFFTVAFGLGSIFLILFRERGGHLRLPIGITCLIATAVGTVLGLYVFDTYTIFPAFYDNARKYTNVVPSEPAAAVSDAGKLVFSTSTQVMVSKAMSYRSEHGVTYCVAPISDGTASFGCNGARIQYWAAGMDCCEKGAFVCDDSERSDAFGGIAIFDNLGYFKASRHDYYEKARKKAEAEFQLSSIDEPMFLRWVKEDDLDMLENSYRSTAVVFSIVSLIVYFILSAGFAYALYTPKTLR